MAAELIRAHASPVTTDEAAEIAAPITTSSAPKRNLTMDRINLNIFNRCNNYKLQIKNNQIRVHRLLLVAELTMGKTSVD